MRGSQLIGLNLSATARAVALDVRVPVSPEIPMVEGEDSRAARGRAQGEFVETQGPGESEAISTGS